MVELQGKMSKNALENEEEQKKKWCENVKVREVSHRMVCSEGPRALCHREALTGRRRVSAPMFLRQGTLLGMRVEGREREGRGGTQFFVSEA